MGASHGILPLNLYRALHPLRSRNLPSKPYSSFKSCPVGRSLPEHSPASAKQRANVPGRQEWLALLPLFPAHFVAHSSIECYGVNGGNPISPLKHFPGSNFRFLFSLSPAALAPTIDDPCGEKESRDYPVQSMSLNGLENRVVLLRVARIKEEAHPVAKSPLPLLCAPPQGPVPW